MYLYRIARYSTADTRVSAVTTGNTMTMDSTQPVQEDRLLENGLGLQSSDNRVIRVVNRIRVE